MKSNAKLDELEHMGEITKMTNPIKRYKGQEDVESHDLLHAEGTQIIK